MDCAHFSMLQVFHFLVSFEFDLNLMRKTHELGYGLAAEAFGWGLPCSSSQTSVEYVLACGLHQFPLQLVLIQYLHMQIVVDFESPPLQLQQL